jgi:hypothetical protein
MTTREEQCLKLSIVIPRIYLTCFRTSQDKQLLLSNGITHVINVSPWGNPHADSFTYLKLDIRDDELEPIHKHFGKVCRFTCDALMKGGNVLFNCAAGISRSPTLVMAFLIRKRRMSFQEALHTCFSARNCIDPNSGFIRLLKQEYLKRVNIKDIQS